jgi:hypothetical protein
VLVSGRTVSRCLSNPRQTSEAKSAKGVKFSWLFFYDSKLPDLFDFKKTFAEKESICAPAGILRINLDVSGTTAFSCFWKQKRIYF